MEMSQPSPSAPVHPPQSHEVAAHQARVAQLSDRLCQLASDLFAGESRFLALVGEFDAIDGWADGHTRSCAHWLNWKLGVAMPAARERVRVARRLRDLPAVAEAFADGRLSYSKVRAVTRVATPATEDSLVGLALFATASQLERICRTWRQVQQQAQPDCADRQQQSRTVQLRVDEDGMLHVTAALPVEVGAAVAQAIGTAAQQLFRLHGPAVDEVEAAQRRADALGIVAEHFLATGVSAETRSDAWQLVVHADAEVVQAAVDGIAHTSPTGADAMPDDPGPPPTDPSGGAQPHDPPPAARVQGGPHLPGPVLRALACDTTVQALVHRDDRPVGVGRRRRLITARLRRLLHRRDQGCQYPGCGNTAWTDAHHLIHWIDGGPTDLDNLIRLCRGHHRQVHARGLVIAADVATRRWVLLERDGQPVPAVHHLPPAGPLPGGAGLSHWEGDPAHMGHIIDGLVDAAGLDGVSAETPSTPAGAPA